MTSNIRKPRTAGNGARAQIKTGTCNSTLFREVIAIVTVGILLAVLMVDSIVGMSSGFAPTNEAIGMMAGVGDDGR